MEYLENLLWKTFFGLWGLMAITMMFLYGCYEYKESPKMYEEAVVVETVYTPAQHGSGVGFDSNADISFTSIDIEEKHAVVFKCEHGKFIIERAELWKRLSEGDTVEVIYKEIYKITDKKKILYDYDFIDAVKLNR